MGTEIESLRTELQNSRQQGTVASDALAERQAELERREQELQALKKEREADLAHRTEVERQNQAVIADAQRQRQEAEAQAMQLKAAGCSRRDRATGAAAGAGEPGRARPLPPAGAERTRRARSHAPATRAERSRSATPAHAAEPQESRDDEDERPRSDRHAVVGHPVRQRQEHAQAGRETNADAHRRSVERRRHDPHRVEGHTDNVGTSAKNQTLSEKRANAVRVFLITSGVPTEKITATGLGEKDPVATNKTATGRQANRRVELVITNG